MTMSSWQSKVLHPSAIHERANPYLPRGPLVTCLPLLGGLCQASVLFNQEVALEGSAFQSPWRENAV